METLSVCPWRREKHYSKVARALGLRVLSLNCCFLRGMEVIPIMLNIKDMLCGASHNCSKSKLYFQHHFSQKSTLFPLSLYLPVKKKKKKKKESSCLRWTEVGFSVGMFTKNWHPLQTMARCHRARVTFHIGSPCGMCAAWDSYQGMTDLWQHCGSVPSQLGGGHGWLFTIKWHQILDWNQCWDESRSIRNTILDHFQAWVQGLKGISTKAIFIFFNFLWPGKCKWE